MGHNVDDVVTDGGRKVKTDAAGMPLNHPTPTQVDESTEAAFSRV